MGPDFFDCYCFLCIDLYALEINDFSYILVPFGMYCWEYRGSMSFHGSKHSQEFRGLDLHYNQEYNQGHLKVIHTILEGQYFYVNTMQALFSLLNTLLLIQLCCTNSLKLIGQDTI